VHLLGLKECGGIVMLLMLVNKCMCLYGSADVG